MKQSSYHNLTTNKRRYRKPKPIKLEQTFDTLAAKFYAEQLVIDITELYKRIREIDPDEFEIIIILHCDPGTKPHFHLIIKAKGGKGTRTGRILKLLGIRFRSGIDDTLMKEHGLETCGDYVLYIRYLLHKSPGAKKKGKQEYNIEDLVSNLSYDCIQSKLDGIENSNPFEILQIEAEELGYNLGNLMNWISFKKLNNLSNSKIKRLMKAYTDGVEKRSFEGATIDRMCICIAICTIIKDRDFIREAVCEAAKEALDESFIVVSSPENKNIGSINPLTRAIIYKGANLSSDKKEIEYVKNIADDQLSRVRVQGGKGSFWIGDTVVTIVDVERDPVTKKTVLCDIKAGKMIIDDKMVKYSPYACSEYFGDVCILYQDKVLSDEELNNIKPRLFKKSEEISKNNYLSRLKKLHEKLDSRFVTCHINEKMELEAVCFENFFARDEQEFVSTFKNFRRKFNAALKKRISMRGRTDIKIEDLNA